MTSIIGSIPVHWDGPFGTPKKGYKRGVSRHDRQHSQSTRFFSALSDHVSVAGKGFRGLGNGVNIWPIYGHIWPYMGVYIPLSEANITVIPVQRCSKVGQNMRFMTSDPIFGGTPKSDHFQDPQNSALARARERARTCARARWSTFAI